jgi:hypothetical protein
MLDACPGHHSIGKGFAIYRDKRRPEPIVARLGECIEAWGMNFRILTGEGTA